MYTRMIYIRNIQIVQILWKIENVTSTFLTKRLWQSILLKDFRTYILFFIQRNSVLIFFFQNYEDMGSRMNARKFDNFDLFVMLLHIGIRIANSIKYKYGNLIRTISHYIYNVYLKSKRESMFNKLICISRNMYHK